MLFLNSKELSFQYWNWDILLQVNWNELELTQSLLFLIWLSSNPDFLLPVRFSLSFTMAPIE